MIFDFTNFRDYLKQVAIDKKAKNPSYSLRAMAQHIGLAPSTFSEVMGGKKNLSVETASLIASKLRLKSKEADYFCLLVQMESAKDNEFKESLQKKLQSLNPRKPVHNLTIDAFKVMADWYHLAILGSLSLEQFEFTTANLASHLKISKLEVETAIDRLLRLELIEKNELGKFDRVKREIFVNALAPEKSLHHYHSQMLAKARECLEGQAFKERIIRTENIVIDEDQIEQADAIIEEFFSKMSALTQRAKRKSRLYHLGTQFFSLIKAGGK